MTRPRSTRPRLVLGIETSCDETAVAIVRDGRHIEASVVASQVARHERFGGVVPEVAGRAHLELLPKVLDEALEVAGLGASGPSPCDRRAPREIDAVAVTYGPGLVASLLVGVSFAKSLSLGWSRPLIGVNHLEGHLYASLLEDPEIELPAVVLLVSGGHTLLIGMSAPGVYQVLGRTLDDAAGEAFDKVARFLGLGYPGGPEVDRVAGSGDPERVHFPRALHGRGLELSFSGLKTAVVNEVRRHPELRTEDVAASFQAAVVEVLTDKALAAAAQFRARSICLAGGVAANSRLRASLCEAAAAVGLRLYLPSRSMCTDNAAMIAAAGTFRLEAEGPSPLHLGAEPGLGFPERSGPT